MGHYVIDQHTGTQQKHRRAFVHRKEYFQKMGEHQATSASFVIKAEPYQSYYAHSQKAQFFRGIYLILMLGLGIWGLWFFNQQIQQQIELTNIIRQAKTVKSQKREAISNSSLHKYYTDIASSKEKQYAFDLNMYHGKWYLQTGYFSLAQEHYNFALRIFKDDKDAMIGLTKTLCCQCIYEGYNCPGAFQYVDYLKLEKIIAEEELELFERFLKQRRS